VISISEILAGIDYAKLAEVIREELDLHTCFSYEKFLREGLDAHFNCRIVKADNTEVLDRISNYWSLTSYAWPFDGELKVPAGMVAVTGYYKRALQYPVMSVRTRLPNWSGVGEGSNRLHWFGFENGAYTGVTMTAFNYRRMSDNTDQMRLQVGGAFSAGGKYVSVNVLPLLPSDYKTNYHVYTVKLARNASFFWCDNSLIAIILHNTNLEYNIGSWTAGSPYAIASCPLPVAQHASPFLELQVYPVINVDLKAWTSPYQVRFSSGDPIQPLDLPLYVASSSTKLAGYSISSGSVTSHPFPLWGYRNRTLLFQADQVGSINIDLLTQTGNWRTYYSDTVSAGNLYWLKITVDGVIARLTFTPSTYPCNIAEAEVVLSG
jgi:hypothetical protein